MKKLFNLKGEIVVRIIISIILGFIFSALLSNLYKNIFYTEDKLISLANERNTSELNMIKNQLHIEDGNEEVVCENIKRLEKMTPESSFINRIFIVDNEGVVKKSNGKFKIYKFNLDKGEGTYLVVNEYKFMATNVMKLNKDRYIVYLNENNIYDDKLMFGLLIVISFMIFLIFINGRIKYINNISKDVRKIATGNLSNRVNLKYNNELTSLAKDINYMAKELENKDLTEKEFITNISHDLRTPLTTILGYSKMLEQRVYSNEEELERYVSIINKKGIYLKNMLDDFFDYTKLCSKDMELEKVKINLNEMIMQLLDGEELYFKEKHLNLNVALENDAIYTYGNSILIARAIDNLISNALKYSKENTEVEIKLQRNTVNKKEYGVFSINNVSKTKMSKDEINDLFKRLYKMDKSRKDEGSGLGLAITNEIVKVHNGFIHTKSNENKIEFSIGFVLES
ncbi:sensor histidine kinase [Clostridium ihumii]|uniref:sensor histidine kinase n=1 Tax=Clostridium ihumii TaxID=1470356 RepID=UPI00055864E2|nr:HAMP domain-containing sensor histidine kinase [Clostridium ihumii]